MELSLVCGNSLEGGDFVILGNFLGLSELVFQKIVDCGELGEWIN
jgi:hypothetical protein